MVRQKLLKTCIFFLFHYWHFVDRQIKNLNGSTEWNLYKCLTSILCY